MGCCLDAFVLFLDIGDWLVDWLVKVLRFVGCCVVVGSYCLFCCSGSCMIASRNSRLQMCPHDSPCSETTPKMVPYMDLNIGFQGLALLDSRPSLCEWEENGWNFQRL